MGKLIQGPWGGGPERLGGSPSLVEELTVIHPAFVQAHEDLSRAVDIFSSINIWPDQCRRALGYVDQLDHIYAVIYGGITLYRSVPEVMVLKQPLIVSLHSGHDIASHIMDNIEVYEGICRVIGSERTLLRAGILRQFGNLQQYDETVIQELQIFIENLRAL